MKNAITSVWEERSWKVRTLSSLQKQAYLAYSLQQVLGVCSLILLGLLCTPDSAHAQIPAALMNPKPTNFSYADLPKLRAVGDVAISPDGKQIAYLESSVDPKGDRVVQSVQVIRVADRRSFHIDVPNPGTPFWSPDSRRLAIPSQNKDGKWNISFVRASDCKVIQRSPLPSSPSGGVWSPDSNSLAFSLFVPDKTKPSFLQSAIDSAGSELKTGAYVSHTPPVQVTQSVHYRLDGGVWQKPGHNHLFVLSTRGTRLREVDSGPFDDREPSWTQNGTALLFTSDRRPDAERRVPESAVFRVDLNDGRLTRLTQAGRDCHMPASSPDGRWIAFTAAIARPVSYTRTDLYAMHADGSEVHPLATRLDRDIRNFVWAGNEQGIYADFDDHGISKVGLLSFDDQVQESVTNVGDGWSVSSAGDFAYAGSSVAAPHSLMLQKVGGRSIVLASSNDFLKGRSLAQLEHVETLSQADGVPVEGWALLPPGRTPGTKLPAILAIHGGPFGYDGPAWSSVFQLYAAAGYAVIYANYRGSISYGSSFTEPVNTAFPGLAFDDLMSITDAAVSRGFVDPDRLFVTGGSAGGQLTMWIAGKTHRFRAAVAEKPVIDNVAYSLTTDQYVHATAPWEHEKELWSQSPLSLTASMVTPTLFITGEKDYRTPLEQTLEMYGALQLKGVPTALMRVPDAGHESLRSRPSQMAAEVAATLAWFHKYDLSATVRETQDAAVFSH